MNNNARYDRSTNFLELEVNVPRTIGILGGVFDICLELPSDSEKYFSLVVDEFSELVRTRKL